MKNKAKIRLTERDVELLKFINTFGFCEIPQIQKKFELKERRVYQVVNRLVEAGLLEHERIFHKKHGICRLTNKGAKYTELPPLSNISLANYKHDLLMVDVYLKLSKLHPEAEWISERQLKHDKYFDGVGKRGHLPDGILRFQRQGEGQEEVLIAIELELTAKNKKRVERILNGYGGSYGTEFSIDEVWYYCSSNVMDFMKTNTARMSFVKVMKLSELLENEKDEIKKIHPKLENEELNAESNA